MRKFVAKGSKAKSSTYDYRSRAKGVMGFEKFSDDDEDPPSSDENSWMVDEDDEDDEDDGEEDVEEEDDGEEDVEEEDDGEEDVGARHRRRKRTNPFESDEEEEEKAVPAPTRRRLIRKTDLSEARDEKATEKRSSARVKTQRAKKSQEAAHHAESLMKSSLDDLMLRQEEQDRLSNESASSASEEDDGFIVDDDEENQGEDEVVDVTSRKKRLSLGADVDEALRSDDGPALVRALARLDEVPRPGRVLISAAAYNASSAVPLLLGKGMRIDGALGKRGDARVHVIDVSEALHAACECGHADFVHAVRKYVGMAQFCRGGATGGWPRNACGGTLVHSAANNEASSAECVRAAIMAESSSDVDSKTELPSWTTLDDDEQGGRTALMIAVSAGDGWENCVAELLGDIKRFGPEKTRAVLLIKELRNGCTAMHLAASSGAVKSLQLFISECASSVNAQDYESATPLHYASMVGKTEAVQLLLRHDADRLARDKSGWIPLLYANFHSERDAVLELLRTQVVDQIRMMVDIARGESEKNVSQVRAVFELLATIPEYYDSINQCVARNRSTGFTIIDMLRASNIMSILDYPNRLAMLRTNYPLPTLKDFTKIRVTKQGDVWNSLTRQYYSDETLLLARDVSCSYDAYQSHGPGVDRDVFTSIAKELCDADAGGSAQLFEQDDAQTYVLKRGLDRASRKIELVMFGELMALVLLTGNNTLLPIPFSTLFMRRVLSSAEKDFSLDELQNAYPQEVKSIRYVLECDDPETLSLSFTDEKGVLVDVTSANRARFASSKRREMTQRIIDDDSASDIRGGLLHILQPAALGILTPEEFILAVCGSHDIDVDEWRRFANSSGSSGEQLAWLWNIVGRMQTSEKALLLQFSTGSTLLPVGGFAKLSPKWSVVFSDYLSDLKLPTTATCFNTMNCPTYPSEEIFQQRLMTAIRHGAAGFAFE